MNRSIVRAVRTYRPIPGIPTIVPVLIHLNSQIVPRDRAVVSVFDRGFLFGDGVYEGLRTTRGRVIGLDRHIERMRMGLSEARITGFDPARLGELTTELIKANGLVEAGVYWQVTRGTPPDGAPPRARLPHPGTRPTVMGFAVPMKAPEAYESPEVRRLSLRPDTRWERGHLKSIALLGGVLAAIEADELGADDAVMHRDGLVTEGTATNVFAVIGGRMVTPSLESAPMLSGVTRALILGEDPTIEVRPVTVDEIARAEEIMLTGTYTMVSAGSTLDGRPIGRGAIPGEGSRHLLGVLRRAIERDVHSPHALAR